MDIYERQQGNEGGMRQTQEAMAHERRQLEELAQLLSWQATEQWRKAVEGLVALPAAIAVGTAARTLYAVGFVTRGFEVFQRSAMELNRARAEEARRREGARNDVVGGRTESFPSA